MYLLVNIPIIQYSYFAFKLMSSAGYGNIIECRYALQCIL